MKFRSALAVITLVLTCIVTAIPSYASEPNPIPPEQRDRVFVRPWKDPNLDPKKVWSHFGTLGGMSDFAGSSGIHNTTANLFCNTNITDCVKNGHSVKASVFATFCSERKQSFCVEKVEFKRKDDTVWTEVDFIGYWDRTPSKETISWLRDRFALSPYIQKVTSFSTMKSWNSDPVTGLIGSAPGPLMFQAPGFSGIAGTDTYLVEPFLVQNLSSFRSGKPRHSYLEKFDLLVKSIVEVKRPQATSYADSTFIDFEGRQQRGGTGKSEADSYLSIDGKVAYASRMNPDVQIRVTILLPSNVGGWFHSRISEPNFELSEISKGQNRLVVSGASAEIPITSASTLLFDPLNPQMEKMICNKETAKRCELWRRNEQAGIGGGLDSIFEPGPSIKSEFMDFWLDKFEESARGKISVWSVSRMQTQNLGTNRCLRRTDRIQGLINTNAMFYQSLIPQYKNGFLEYEVAGVHRNSNGEIFRGEYDLVIRSDAARCLYGFTKAPISGTITVVDEDNQTSVATTTLGEANGWLKLSAKNFTFSQKTIRVKFSQTLR